MKKICVVTGSRADYGLLKNLLELLKKQKNMIYKLLLAACIYQKNLERL